MCKCGRHARKNGVCHDKTCEGEGRPICKCGRQAMKKGGVCANVECGGAGRSICKVEGCARVVYENGMCQNKECTGKVRTYKLCSFPGGCTNHAKASRKNSKGIPGVKGRCRIHKGGPRCIAEGCPYGVEKGTGSCIGHDGGIRCAECKLFSVRSRGFKCFGCRTGTDRVKELEALVKDFLEKHEFLKMYTCTDVRIGCDNNRRPDFVYPIAKTHVIIIEVDEDAHRSYNKDCEIVRVSELKQTCNAKPLFLIRFNPLVTVQGELKCTEELKSIFDAFRTAEITPETPTLTVQFIGYKQEYDVAAEMDRVAKERAAAGLAEQMELEEEMDMEESEEEEASEDMKEESEDMDESEEEAE